MSWQTTSWRTRSMVAVGIAVALVAAAGCSSSKKATGPTSVPGGTRLSTASANVPVNGGVLKEIHDSDPSGLMDPVKMQLLSETSGADMFYDIYSALLYLDDSTTPPAVQPLLAQSFTTSDGGKTWVLRLRPNLVFSDGTPLNAAAVQYNWNRLLKPSNAAPMASSLADVASTTVTNAQTLTVALKQPNTLFMNLVAEGAAAYIASPTAIAKEGANYGLHPVGAGPFVLQSWSPDSSAALVKSPTYFDASNVHLDGVDITTSISNTTQEDAFCTGAVDMTFVGQTTIANSIKGCGGTVGDSPLMGPIDIVWNMTKAPFTDQAMRVAFTEALNRDALAQAYNSGIPDPQPPGLLDTTSPYYDSKAVFPKYDPTAAKQAIQTYEATHGPIKLTFLYVSGSPATLNLASVLQQQLQAMPGVTVTLDGTDLTNWFVSMFDLKYSIGNNGLPDPEVADPYIYNYLHTRGSSNLSGYSNPKVDAALDNARTTTNAQQQLADYDTVQEAVTADAFSLPYTTGLYAEGYNKKVHYYGFGDAIPRTDLIWCTGGVC